MANFTDPIRAAFGVYMHSFREGLIADTRALQEFASRPFAEACVWAPGRIVDQVDEMLKAYRKNDNSGAVQPKTKLPIMIVGMAKDFQAAPPEFGRNLSSPVDVTIPGDPRNRVFRMRAVVADIRTQVAIIAADEPTARSIAMQLHTYTSAIENRTFRATYKLAGITDTWPVMLEIPDLLAASATMADDVKNLTALVLDITLRATVPLLTAPHSTEPNDHQGSGPNQDDPFAAGYDPSGYLVVSEARIKSFLAGEGETPLREWLVVEMKPFENKLVADGAQATSLHEHLNITLPEDTP